MPSSSIRDAVARAIGLVQIDANQRIDVLRKLKGGVWKTTDAGRTWSKVLFVDSLTGATELVIDPRDPNVLCAATYQRLRSAFGFNGGGPGSGLWKTTDGGTTWSALPTGPTLVTALAVIFAAIKGFEGR